MLLPSRYIPDSKYTCAPYGLVLVTGGSNQKMCEFGGGSLFVGSSSMYCRGYAVFEKGEVESDVTARSPGPRSIEVEGEYDYGEGQEREDSDEESWHRPYVFRER